jgi:RNA polymerase sigma factor (sigma-70 family)
MAAEQPELEQYMDVVRGVARGLARRLRVDAVDIEELEADGFEALVKALNDHESSKGPLVPYIILRCRGAMIDGLRRRMLITREDHRAGVTEPAVVSLEDEVADGIRLLDVIADPSSPTPDGASVPVTTTPIPSEVAALPRRHQRILLARYLQRRSQREIAAAEGISQNRLVQIESHIRRRLRGVAGFADSGQLTPKELTVLRLAAEGASAAETAKRLRKAVETVKSQRCAIISKLHARNMTNAVAISYQRGLLGAAVNGERGAGGSSARHR